MKLTTKGETIVDMTPLLKHGKWGLIAFVVIALVYIVATKGMDFQVRLGPSSTLPASVAGH